MLMRGWTGRIRGLATLAHYAGRRLKKSQTSLRFYSPPTASEPSVLILSLTNTKLNKDLSGLSLVSWLDRQDSNLRMLGPKPSALPLGDGPIFIILP